MKRVKVKIEMDEDVVDKIREWMKMESDYEKAVCQTVEGVVTEMFYLSEEGKNAIDLRHKVTVTAIE